MRKLLLVLVAMTATCRLFADEWKKPVYAGAYQPLTDGEVVYIYNTEAKMFLGAGNEYGTHATLLEDGMQFMVKQYVPEEEGAEWDGKTYVILTNWDDGDLTNVFITDGGHVYLDRREQADYFFSFQDLGGNTYQIYGADSNPVWNATGENADYMLGRYTKYVYVNPKNAEDTYETGTGVIYDFNGTDSSYGEGEFQTKWAFVSTDDYAAYDTEIELYSTAMKLKAALDKAAEIGVPALEDEKKVYADTNSDIDALEAAIESVNKKTLAYYEVYVTPERPMEIDHDDCNTIDEWENELNVTDSEWVKSGVWTGTEEWNAAWVGFEGTYRSLWSASMSGTANKVWMDLPNGIYVVKISVYSQDMDAYIFANQNKKSVGKGGAGAVYEVTTNVTDGTLVYGFGQDEEGTNWVTLDNAIVTYYGKGTEALKYWINSLKESTADYSDAIVQPELVTEYNNVMEEVGQAETEEEILAVIPKMEDVVNRINLNMAAYGDLSDAINIANTLISNESINTRYGDALSDMVGDKEQILIAHTKDTDVVLAETDELNLLSDEAQTYIWRFEDFISELQTAEGIYLENQEICPAAAKDAYNAFKEKYAGLTSKNDMAIEDVTALLDELYAIEFNLQLTDEPASDENPADYTAKIYNPSFNGVDGWDNVDNSWMTFANNTWYGFANEEGASSGDGNYLNLWSENNATASQTITGLPAGAYTVSCGAYADNEGFELFANDNTVSVEVGRNGAGEYMRIYTIPVLVGEDGMLVIGARNTNGGIAWAMVDEYHLTYYGTESQVITGVSAVPVSAKKPVRTYNLAGQVVNAAYKGIVIRDGVKVLVK